MDSKRTDSLTKTLEIIAVVMFLVCLRLHKPFGAMIFLFVFVLADDVISGLGKLKESGLNGLVGEHNIRMALILVIIVVLYLYHKWFR